MIKILSKYDDNTDLDTLATKSDYIIELHKMNDGSTTSAMCQGENAGLKALEVIDHNKLLADKNHPFPFIEASIIKYLAPLINKIGL